MLGIPTLKLEKYENQWPGMLKIFCQIISYLTLAHCSRIKSFRSEIIIIEILSIDLSIDLGIWKKCQEAFIFQLLFPRIFIFQSCHFFLVKSIIFRQNHSCKVIFFKIWAILRSFVFWTKWFHSEPDCPVRVRLLIFI